MKEKPISAFEFVEQIIARAIAQKEGKNPKLNGGGHYTLIVNPFIYDNKP